MQSTKNGALLSKQKKIQSAGCQSQVHNAKVVIQGPEIKTQRIRSETRQCFPQVDRPEGLYILPDSLVLR